MARLISLCVPVMGAIVEVLLRSVLFRFRDEREDGVGRPASDEQGSKPSAEGSPEASMEAPSTAPALARGTRSLLEGIPPTP